MCTDAKQPVLVFHSHFSSIWFDGNEYIQRSEVSLCGYEKGTEIRVSRQVVKRIATINGTLDRMEQVENSFREICKCGTDYVYSKTLTNGMCLNCYQDWKDDNRLMEIEIAHDYAQGLI